VDDDKIPGPFRNETTVAGHIQTRWSQAELLHKELTPPLQVVIIATTHLQTQARVQVMRFSRDRELADAPLVDDDGVRFHIECNVRDATQSWGLADCMHVTSIGVANAAHLSWCMVKVASQLRTDGRQRAPDDRVLDLKADGRGDKDVEETINMLPEQPEPIV
jgi:hypothetical protein